MKPLANRHSPVLSAGIHRRGCSLPIPKGLHPPAQGCQACEATLGYRYALVINRNAVAAVSFAHPQGQEGRNPVGVVRLHTRFPR